VRLVAGVGYAHLRDLSFGSVLVERLQRMAWPEDVRIEDFGYGPIAILHWFEEIPGRRFERAIFVGAMERDRVPGTLVTYDWIPRPLDPDNVQARIAEAVTGVISLENLLIIAQHFDLLPRRTTVIEIEPPDKEFGLGLSPLGEERLTEVIAWLRHEVDITATGGHTGNGTHKEVSAR
jgi:hydrogenase maturation protease